MIENLGDKANTNGFDKRPQARNNNGAPTGKRASTIIKELLEGDAVSFTDNKDYKELDGNTALAVELITMAFSKDNKPNEKLNAIKEILDRIEGKPQQNVDVKDLRLGMRFESVYVD